MQDILIETPRLIIRPPTLDDLDSIQSAKEAAWPELQKWMSWSSDDQKPIEPLRRHIEEATLSKDNILLCAFHKATQDFVISTGIYKYGEEAGVFSTGYWANPDYVRQGYATEATNAVIRYGFNVLGIKGMHISYYEGNKNSARIIEKLGFEFTHTEPERHHRHSNGELLDVHNFMMNNSRKLPNLEVNWN